MLTMAVVVAPTIYVRPLMSAAAMGLVTVPRAQSSALVKTIFPATPVKIVPRAIVVRIAVTVLPAIRRMEMAIVWAIAVLRMFAMKGAPVMIPPARRCAPVTPIFPVMRARPVQVPIAVRRVAVVTAPLAQRKFAIIPQEPRMAAAPVPVLCPVRPTAAKTIGIVRLKVAIVLYGRSTMWGQGILDCSMLSPVPMVLCMLVSLP